MNPKYYSQIERAIQCFNKSSTTDFLKDNPQFFFIFKKTERFVAALYILTELFPDSEPIKWELRSSGASFSRDILSFRKRISILSKENISAVFGTVIRIASLLEIAHIANFVSAMNLSLFRKELDMLASFIESRGKTGGALEDDPHFHESFFHISANISDTGHAKNEPIGSKRSPADVSPSRFRQSGELPSSSRKAVQESNVKKDIEHKGHSANKESVLYETPKVHKGHYPVTGKGEDRRRTILDVLKTRNLATIKDFSLVIGGCSEKTVQRALLKMVQEGLLKKEGERRWSHYSLA